MLSQDLLHQLQGGLADRVSGRQPLLGARQLHKVPELLSEVGAQVGGQPGVVLQDGQQEATALEQQDGLKWTQRGLLRVRQDQHQLLDLVPDEGQLQGDEETRRRPSTSLIDTPQTHVVAQKQQLKEQRAGGVQVLGQ
ncbi:hypothetical protein EYF80_060776 [Liparis tanakae]|uniref:Uncharacterized protein n=1 Tax=Liparis tanakae TaxID=230148 RepID=A0A4Z2EJF8_9TELE|nr:hypothetical protein EYF80_060776 [Liparis tanakae]